MSEDTECPHGMEDPNWCSICKHKDDIIVYIPDNEEYSFVARFAGTCGECKDPIQVGDRCRHTPYGANVHEECIS